MEDDNATQRDKETEPIFPRLETHITVAGDTDLDALQPLAWELGLKVLHIVLARGETPSQPMLTFQARSGLERHLARAEAARSRLASEGITVTRIKVEADWTDVYPTPARQLVLGWAHPGRGKQVTTKYLEAHLKIKLDDAAPSISELERIAVSQGAHLSKNAIFKQDAVEHRFVTLRDRNEYWVNGRFLLLYHLIDFAGFEILKTERELVLYDSNPAVDDHWLQPEREREQTRPPVKQEWPTAYELTSNDDRPKIFDPALKHYMSGFRTGTPVTADNQWHVLRGQIFATLLAAVAETDLRDMIIARGSALMPYWIGDAARPPGDIDWVVFPDSIKMTSEQGGQIIDEMAALIGCHRVIGDATLVVEEMATDDIWTYDRVPGRRITVPWSAPGLPTGTIQMDFVFQEELWLPPVKVSLDGFGEDDYLLAAGPEQSLAWKLLWLATDDHPQGKDLYDAVLLAEDHPIDKHLILRALTDDYRNGMSLGREPEDLGGDLVKRFHVEWEWVHLKNEYPQITDPSDTWVQRLADALQPAFDAD